MHKTRSVPLHGNLCVGDIHHTSKECTAPAALELCPCSQEMWDGSSSGPRTATASHHCLASKLCPKKMKLCPRTRMGNSMRIQMRTALAPSATLLPALFAHRSFPRYFEPLFPKNFPPSLWNPHRLSGREVKSPPELPQPLPHEPRSFQGLTANISQAHAQKFLKLQPREAWKMKNP